MASYGVDGTTTFRPGHVRVPALEAVRVLGAELAAGAAGHADDERDVDLAVRHVVQLRRVVDDLVDREQAEVDRHQLDHRLQAGHRRADAGADDDGLSDRRVAHALLAELVEEALRDGVGAAVSADVLAHEEHAFVVLELLAQRLRRASRYVISGTARASVRQTAALERRRRACLLVKGLASANALCSAASSRLQLASTPLHRVDIGLREMPCGEGLA